jgi:hypothetical protein
MCEDVVRDASLTSRNRGRHSTPLQTINRIRYNQKETFAIPYEASLVESEKKIQDLEAQGIRPIKVAVDVEALLTWCTTQGLAVTPETRTKFMMNAFRDLVRKGIIKP